MRRWREGLGGSGAGEGLFVARLLVEEIRYLTSPETVLKVMSVIGPFACMKT